MGAGFAAVTGGSGHVGGSLVRELLAGGHEVRVLVGGDRSRPFAGTLRGTLAWFRDAGLLEDPRRFRG